MTLYGENGQNYPSLIEAIVLIVLFITLQLICGLGVIFFNIQEGTPLMFFFNFMVIPVFSGITVISYGLWRGERKWRALADNTDGVWATYFSVLVMFTGLSIVLSEIDNWVRYFYPMTDLWREIFHDIYEADIWLSFIGIAIIPPIIEEMLFRGIILKGFLQRYNPWIAITLSSLLFALMHLNLWQIIAAFIAGLFLGWIYYKTRSLFLVIFAHALVNGISILGSRYTNIQDFTDSSPFQPLWFNLTGISLLLIGLFIFKSTFFYNNNPEKNR